MVDFEIDDIHIQLPLDKQFKECPHCQKTTTGRQNILSFFGERTMKGGTVIYQSWCKPCRNYRKGGRKQ